MPKKTPSHEYVVQTAPYKSALASFRHRRILVLPSQKSFTVSRGMIHCSGMIRRRAKGVESDHSKTEGAAENGAYINFAINKVRNNFPSLIRRRLPLRESEKQLPLDPANSAGEALPSTILALLAAKKVTAI